ncbi:phage tail tape measure protein [Lactococcus garvieae]|uniref:phage tail tape measure protein n=1 Tax=Lactococcus garvieae TaxID=1363 RepID=UPI000312B459|nr:phage tail tape measure protein [Lactococcus garvieae]
MTSEMIGSVTTGIDLNETKAVESINRLKSAVRDVTREWQINEAQSKSAGDAVSASKIRYEGLSDAVEKQKVYISNLSDSMKTINRDTEAGEKAYQKYNGQLTTAERSLASMTGQLNRAKTAYEYQQTGIEGLNKSLSANDKLMKSQIDLYEKTKNKMGAAKAEISGLSTSYTKQTEIYKAQVRELNRLEIAEDTSSEALVKQRIRVNEAATALVGYRNKLLEANHTLTKLQPYNPNNIVGKGLNSVYRTSEKVTTAMATGFQKVKSAAYSSAFGIAAIGAAAIKGAQAATELQNSYKTTFNLLVTGGEEAAEAQENVNKMQEEGAEMSVKYGVSQKDIAAGYQELVKRGYSSAQALGAMNTILQGSVASGDDFSDVVHNATATLESFGMKVDDVNGMNQNTKEVVNQMAYAADLTATDFHSLGKAMEYVGASASLSKISLSETSAAIGVLSNNGLEADKAGTGLRKVIISLQSPTEAAAGALEEIGIKTKDFVDQEGNMKSMTEIFGMINKHSEKMSSFEKGQLFHTLFGTTGQQAGSILSANAKDLGELTEKVKEAADGAGYVKTLADKNMKSAENELKQFKQAGEAVLIMIGEKFLPVLSDAAISMREAFESKEGKKGLEEIAIGVSKVFQGIVNLIKYIGTHKDEVIVFGKAFAAIWAVNKIGNTLIWLDKVRNSLLEIKAIDALSGGLGTGGISKGAGKTAIKEAEVIGTSAIKGGVSETEILASTGALNKVTSLLPRILGILGSVAGSTLLSGGINAGAELLSKDSNSQKGGGVAGSLGGAAAGAAIGSMIAPGIGTAVGAALGGLGGKDLGRKLGDMIEQGINESKLKSEKLPVIKFDPKAPNEQMKVFSKDYQKFLDEINDSSNVDIINEKSLNDAKKSTADAYKKMSNNIDDFYKKQEKDSKKQVNILLENGVISKKEADKLNKGQINADNTRKKEQKKVLSEMQKATENYYANVEKEQKKSNNDEAKRKKQHSENLKKIQSGQTKELLEIEKKYGKKSPQYVAAVNAAKKKENDSFNANEQKSKKAHSDKMTSLEKAYVNKQADLEEKMNSEIAISTKIAQNKQLDSLIDLKNKKGKLNKQQLTDALITAEKEFDAVKDKANAQKDAAVKAANEKYKKTVEAADKERAQNSNMSKQQYDAIVKNAQRQRDDTISAANKQKDKTIDHAQTTYNKTTNLARSKADDNIKAAARERKQTVYEYSNGLKDTGNAWNSFRESLNKIWTFLKKPLIPGFATGTQGLSHDEVALVGEEGFELAHHPSKGIFAVGANGPEIRDLQAGTSILPHSMSKEFLAMTTKLPAHASGVEGFISNMFEGVKDIASLISKGPENVISKVFEASSVAHTLDNKSSYDDPIGSLAFRPMKSTNDDANKSTKDSFVEFAKGIFQKVEKEAGGNQGAPSGAGVQRWAGQVKQALAANGLSTSQSMIDKVLRQIQTESGGNEKAVQGDIGDINNITGDLAKGLMQTISATFNAYKFPGHGDIFNGYDNLLAALNYAKSRYGPDLSFLGQGHGYENGGIISSHGFYEIAEGNRPEMVIPLDSQKKSRATQLLSQASRVINGGKPNQNNDDSVDFSSMITLLSQLVNSVEDLKKNPIPAYAMIDGKIASKYLAPNMKQAISDVDNKNRCGLMSNN